MVARHAPDYTAEVVKDEVLREAARSDHDLMSMLDLSLAQVAAGKPMIPVTELKARLGY